MLLCSCLAKMVTALNSVPRNVGLSRVPDQLPEVPEGSLMHLHLDHNQVAALFIGELFKAVLNLEEVKNTVNGYNEATKRANFIGVYNCRM